MLSVIYMGFTISRFSTFRNSRKMRMASGYFWNRILFVHHLPFTRPLVLVLDGLPVDCRATCT